MTDRAHDRTGQGGGESGRALVLRDRPSPGDERPLADFLAQLIACDRRLPAYRLARQDEPSRAVTAYGRARAGAEAVLDLSV